MGSQGVALLQSLTAPEMPGSLLHSVVKIADAVNGEPLEPDPVSTGVGMGAVCSGGQACICLIKADAVMYISLITPEAYLKPHHNRETALRRPYASRRNKEREGAKRGE